MTGSLPFGMISSAPLTRNINQGGGGYNYNSTKVLGFPQIHNWMISGLSLMPVKDEVDVCRGDKVWRSSFSHDDEIVQPGYHRLFLDTYKIWVEQTVTDRSRTLSFYVYARWFGEGLGKSGRSYSYFYFVERSCDKGE